MKKDNISKLLDLLKKNSQPISGKNLSQLLGVSSRTIRNYIAEINSDEQNHLILSTSKGYSITKPKNKKIKRIRQTDLPDVILKHLLSNNSTNIFELAQTLHISDYTLRNIIREDINPSLKPYSLKIQGRNFSLTVKGTEQSKRQLINDFIKKDRLTLVSKDKLCHKMFSLNNKKIEINVTKIINASDLHFTHYAESFLTLQIIIALNRIYKGYKIIGTKNRSIQISDHERNSIDKLISSLSDYCQQILHINITRPEREHLKKLIFVCATKDLTNNKLTSLISLVGKEFFS